MMKSKDGVLIKDGQLINDPFAFVADDNPSLPIGQAVIVSLERWQKDRSNLIAHSGLIGVRLKSGQLADSIADDLKYLSSISIEFPSFSDGRGFSTARTLREQYGYEGEIRAVGHVIRDQYLFLHRCGINAIELDDRNNLQAWQTAMEEISLFYQTTPDDRLPVMSLRQRSMATTG